MAERLERGQKVAVVGGGVAGIVAAYLLQGLHEVTLFEANGYLGGHTHTVEIPDGPDAGLAVDTGFIVLNDATYPLFQRFLARLGVATRVSEMSFGFHCRQTGLVYAGTDLNGLFAQRRNLVSPAFYRFLLEIARFCKKARLDLGRGAVPQVTLGRYLEDGRFSPFMAENYLVPMGAAIWSTPALRVADFPAEPFLRFFQNHGLLSFRNRPDWRTVVGGSHAYVKAFLRGFGGSVHLRRPVRKVTREPGGVRLALAGGETAFFDQAVIATHADQALRLLGDPSETERRLLSPWRYQRNRTVLHTDASLLPRQRRARAAWNFSREAGAAGERPVFVTYDMNRLQGLSAQRDYCVTLNRDAPFRPETVIAEMDYHHPLYTFESMATQAELPRLGGRRRTWYCGSYFGYGFHEDAVRAGAAVGQAFGGEL
ncbi:MAG: amine oxidase [Desulfuromonas sp.]|uniref:NAD(P)/FAD-dependent oxidoreductase n=1 Tax=Desulfuromonas sp. TaxID=892 RepID=UPI000CB6331A|nr:FAD-dependent oxidoreductase [Desulfuromonas sp.]PLX83285.1 MAG: amine oxidase [Desulfuromonas sp.]